MKSRIMAIAALAMLGAMPLMAKDSVILWFKTKGSEPDKYADGTQVKEGERYALVWTRNGEKFEGITVEGKAVNEENSKVWIGGRGATKAGKCPKSALEIDRSEKERLVKDGTFKVCLLDTRRADGEPGGLEAGVNAYGDSCEVSLAGKGDGSSTSIEANAVASRASNDDKMPQPKIKSIELKDGYVYLTVESTSPKMRYGVKSGRAPEKLEEGADAEVKDGSADGTIVLKARATENGRFFRVGRAPVTK